MDENSLNARLSRISTLWTLVGQAHREGHDDARKARVTVLERYQRAIYRYLLGAARDPDAADELFQDFAVRFVQGGFRRADPARGRFRDYLKTALIHLVSDYQRRQQKRPCPLDTALVQPETPPDEASDTGQQFDQTWREELLQRAWDVLKAAETEGGPPYYTALRFRAEHPQACSAETAAFLTEHLRLQPPPSEVAVRKALQRARANFADALIDEVVHSLGTATRDDVEQELGELELLIYCRSALDRRWPRA